MTSSIFLRSSTAGWLRSEVTQLHWQRWTPHCGGKARERSESGNENSILAACLLQVTRMPLISTQSRAFLSQLRNL